jgi:hypothetical protein
VRKEENAIATRCEIECRMRREIVREDREGAVVS